MLEVLHDDKGNIKAVCDYLIVNKEKALDDEGYWMIIEEIEINPEYRNNGMLWAIIKTLLVKFPDVEICSFKRLAKYPNRVMRTYNRKQFELLIKGGRDGFKWKE